MPEAGAGTQGHSLFGRTGSFYVQRASRCMGLPPQRLTDALSAGLSSGRGPGPERRVRGRTTRRIDTSWFHSATRSGAASFRRAPQSTFPVFWGSSSLPAVGESRACSALDSPPGPRSSPVSVTEPRVMSPGKKLFDAGE